MTGAGVCDCAGVAVAAAVGSAGCPSAVLSSSSCSSIASLLIYADRQIGQLVLRSTNQDTKHSAWNSWPQTRSLRILSASASASDEAVVGSGIEAGRAASSVIGVSGLSFAGSGGAGAYRVDRHIALQVRQ